MARPRVVMALMFFPRGGSSHVVRNLARFLPEAGWDVTLVTGSLGPRGADSNAETFFDGFEVHKVDDETYEHIVGAWEKALDEAGAGDADLLHLNHLTPMHEAAMRSFPDVPR